MNFNEPYIPYLTFAAAAVLFFLVGRFAINFNNPIIKRIITIVIIVCAVLIVVYFSFFYKPDGITKAEVTVLTGILVGLTVSILVKRKQS